MKVSLGKKQRITFYAENLSGSDIVARAVPSITPGHGAQYLKKVECFCFDEMLLQAGAKEEMPVVFYLDSEFPDDITTITLAYKAFDITDQVQVVENDASPEKKQDLIN
jgi:cytochrome c oxidase assembly protein subunit 11